MRTRRPVTDGYGYVPLRIPKMAELVSQRLRRQIVHGELLAGDALPSEAALMAQFGVSRPTLREAFRVLEAEGLISVRRGAHGGARVQVPNGAMAARYAGLVLEHRGTTLADVYGARNIIEPACAALLARRGTAAECGQLRAALEASQARLGEPHALIRLHNEFHALVVSLAGNQTMTVLDSMVRHIIDLSSYAHIAADAGTPAYMRATRRGHRAHEKLVDLIEAGDADAAQALWTTHVAEAESYLLGGSNPETVLDLLS